MKFYTHILTFCRRCYLKANELRGYTILIPANSRSELEAEDEFYAQDLCGLKVHKVVSYETHNNRL